MSHPGTERRLLRVLVVDVQRVEVAGDPGEQVDVGLGDRLAGFTASPTCSWSIGTEFISAVRP